MNRWKPAAFLLALVGLTLARLSLAAHTGLSEAEALAWAGRMLPDTPGPPAPLAALVRLGTHALGSTPLGVRVAGILLGLGAIVPLLSLAKDRVLLAGLLLLLPVYAVGGLFATAALPLALAWAFGLAAAQRGWWGEAGAAVALAWLSHPMGGLLALLILAEPAAARQRSAWLGGALALGAAWIARDSIFHYRISSSHLALVDLLLQVGPVLPFAALGLWTRRGRGTREDLLAWLASAPPGIGGLLLGDPALLAAGWAGVAVGLSRQEGRLARSAQVGLGIGSVMSLLGLLHLSHPLLLLAQDPTDRFRGGAEIAQSVAAWGLSDVVAERPEDAALIRFYGGVPAVPRAEAPPTFDHGLYVRPWSGAAPMDLPGYDTDGPQLVSAYANTPDGQGARPIARWQVYEIHRETPGPASDPSTSGL